jgi:predicted alpha/beta superfamily hydrolase
VAGIIKLQGNLSPLRPQSFLFAIFTRKPKHLRKIMKQLFALLAAACLLAACNRPNGNSNSNKIVIGTIDSVNSTILHETRKIWVYVPDSYKANGSTSQRYPVVYLLDGDGHFSSVVGMIQQLSTVNGNTVYPEMIVVGIPNTDRTRDLTPTHVTYDPPYITDTNFSKTSGGGEQFMAFIEKELMPYIDSAYPANPYKVLIGHSFGGLTVINALMHHTKLFNAYLAIDPSMWWDGRKLLNEVHNNIAGLDLSHTAVYLGMANTMNPGMDTTKVQADTTPIHKHIRSILTLNHYLSADKQSGFRYASRYYGTDNHGSVPLISEYDGLHFIFDYYNLPLTNSDFGDINKAVIAKIENHFDTVSARMGFKVQPPELFINQLAYQASATKHNDEAIYLAQLNTTNYPTSSNTFDTLGDIYDAAGNKPKAIESYQKALAINKNMPDTKKKLDKLQAK